ncbi:MAG TPA: hypothetical protein VGI82_14725 [Chitinophagaceae bacterium]|jgi:hypothetical protein
MKKILMVAALSTLTVGAFANGHKQKKHKQSEQCTKCTPECKANGCCDRSHCVKA